MPADLRKNSTSVDNDNGAIGKWEVSLETNKETSKAALLPTDGATGDSETLIIRKPST